MNELSWLLDLFLSHKLSPKTKEHVALRLNEVAQRMTISVGGVQPQAVMVNGVAQAPSTAQALARHGVSVPVVAQPIAEPVEPGIVAANAITAQALESRARALEQAKTGKVEPGRTSPRKF